MRCTLLLTSVAALGLTALTGCVDDDYDLSKDMDLNVTVGGDLYLPASSTGELTLANVFDLADDSSIKVIDGSYMLIEDAEPTKTTVSVEQVKLNDTEAITQGVDVPFVPGGSLQLPADFVSDINISDNNVDQVIKQLDEATTDLELELDINYTSAVYTGDITVKAGYAIIFDPRWEISVTDATTLQYAKTDGTNKVVFSKDKTFSKNNPLILKINLERVLLGSNKGEGLYAPGKFDLSSAVSFEGDIAINAAETSIGNVHLQANINFNNAVLTSVTGIVDPEVNINDTSVEISDIPDFLDNDENNLDIENPQVFFTVNNESPVSVKITALISAEYSTGKNPTEIYIGKWADGRGTDEILITPGLNQICLSRTGVGSDPEVTYIRVEKLGDLLTTIPDRIAIKDIDAKVVQEPVTFVFKKPGGKGYTFDCDYKAMVPLAFGPDMRLVYDDDDSGWDSEDLDKVSFNTVEITMNVTNTVPLAFTPDVELLDDKNNPMNNVVVDTHGSVIAADGTSSLRITATCKEGETLAGVNGLRYVFTATSQSNAVGKTLKPTQGMKFDDIKIMLKGGVTYDLND